MQMVNSCMFWCIVNVTVHVVVRKEDVKVFPKLEFSDNQWDKTSLQCEQLQLHMVVSMSDDWIVLYVEGCRGSSTALATYVIDIC